MSRKIIFTLLFIILFGFALRIYYLYPDNLILGYDQIEDIINVRRIVDYHDLIVIDNMANPTGLNHGVLFNYLMAVPYWLGGGRPMVMAYWDSALNSLAVIPLFILAFSLFGSVGLALTSSWLMAISYRMVLMSGWISITTAGLWITPVFFLGFWLYRQKKNWGLVLSAFCLGLLIQSQLLMIYNFLVVMIIWLCFRLKVPKLKTVLFSAGLFLVAVSTMIMAEVKSGFSTLKAFLKPALYLSESQQSWLDRVSIFGKHWWECLSQIVSPVNQNLGLFLGLVMILVLVYYLFLRKTNRKDHEGVKLLLLFLVAPGLMVVVGYHDQPWTLMAMIPAVYLLFAWVISKIHSKPFQFLVVLFFTVLNLTLIIKQRRLGTLFIPQEPSSTLRGQLAVLAYTYQEAGGKPFAINTVTYPLYYNTYWSYHYPWYAKAQHQPLPGWLGGDQLYPYNSLPKASGNEPLFFMIIDQTKAIPEVHREIGRKWGYNYGQLSEEKNLGGFLVQKFVRKNIKTK